MYMKFENKDVKILVKVSIRASYRRPFTSKSDIAQQAELQNILNAVSAHFMSDETFQEQVKQHIQAVCLLENFFLKTDP